MSGKLFDRYGAILQEDVDVLETCLREVINDIRGEKFETGHMRAARVIEIGMHDGGTARGIENFLRDREVRLAYVGIDPDDGKTRPRYVPEGGRVIVGDSAEVFHEVPDGADLVWVDGCHCRGHVILDTLNFHTKVRVGGFMLFHDINPAGQGKDHQYHGPEIPEFGLAIDAAHKLMRWPSFEGWGMVLEKWPTDVLNCGTRAYRRIF